MWLFLQIREVWNVEISTKPLKDALEHLEINIGLVSSSLADASPALRDKFRTASIKSFEYCYSFSLKMIKRRLEERAAEPDLIEEASFRTFIRSAWEIGLVHDLEEWDRFRKLRNDTAHTYDARQAEAVFQDLPKFVSAVKFLLAGLEVSADAH